MFVYQRVWSFMKFQNCAVQIRFATNRWRATPTYVHVISGTALVAMAGNEICGLIATYMGSKNLWPKSLENFDYLTLLCKTWIASCRIMPCRLISQVSKMARLIPADFFFRFRKVGFFRTLDEQRLEKSLAWGRRKLWSHIYRAAVYPASCWRWCSAGWGCRGVLLRPSGCQFGPRPFQCRRTHCDGAAIFVCWLQHVTTVNR